MPVEESTGKPIERKGKWEPNRDRISIDVLESIFTEIYFVPVRDTDNVFASVTSITPARAHVAVSRWIAQQESLRELQDSSGAQAIDKASGFRVFVWFDNNLRTLHAVWKGRTHFLLLCQCQDPRTGLLKCWAPGY